MTLSLRPPRRALLRARSLSSAPVPRPPQFETIPEVRRLFALALQLRREGLLRGRSDADLERLARSCTEGREVVDERLEELRRLVLEARTR